MNFNRLWLAVLVTVLIPGPVLADAADGFGAGANTSRGADTSRELPPYLQCVPYARQVSGIAIYGDAYTWWDKAEGRYERGHRPRVGAVLAFRPHGSMQLGHVAAVSKVIDNRTVLLRHANWSPINGRRGQIEDDVRAIDVSPDNDWSQVRVWYDPIQSLGTTAWPTHGFIYGNGRIANPPRLATRPVRPAVVTAATEPTPAPRVQPARRESSAAFRTAFADLERTSASPAPQPQRLAPAPRPPVKQVAAPRQRAAVPALAKDPFAAVIARYEN